MKVKIKKQAWLAWQFRATTELMQEVGRFRSRGENRHTDKSAFLLPYSQA